MDAHGVRPELDQDALRRRIVFYILIRLLLALLFLGILALMRAI